MQLHQLKINQIIVDFIMEEDMVDNLQRAVFNKLMNLIVNGTVNKTVSQLEQENKELKEELIRRLKIKNSIDVEYRVIE